MYISAKVIFCFLLLFSMSPNRRGGGAPQMAQIWAVFLGMASLSDSRLNSLAMLSIKNELAHSIDLGDVIKQFAMEKARREKF